LSFACSSSHLATALLQKHTTLPPSFNQPLVLGFEAPHGASSSWGGSVARRI
jgi:hypothetical protein